MKYLIFILLLLAVTSFKLTNTRSVYCVKLSNPDDVINTIKNKTKEGYKVVNLCPYLYQSDSFSDFILIMEK